MKAFSTENIRNLAVIGHGDAGKTQLIASLLHVAGTTNRWGRVDEGTTVIAAHACSYGLMLYEKFLPTLQDFAKRYPNFYADISALTLPNRMGMLLHLRRHPELHDRLLFGTDYPLSVFHLAAWGRVGLRALRNIVRTTNRFDRQVAVCGGLGINFRSFGALIASSSPD